MMQLAAKLLLATDCSTEARRAQEVAMFLAKACRAELGILSVLEAPPGMDPEYQVNQLYLEQLRTDVRKQTDLLVREAEAQGLTVKAEIVSGMPSQQINEAAKARKSDLIIMGTRGRTGLAHVLLGSTAEGVVRGAPCPVLTVRSVPGRGQPAPALQIRHILVPVDFSDCSIEALEYAVQAARVFAASVTILHVLEPASYGLDFTLSHAGDAQRARTVLETRLDDFATLFREQGLTAGASLKSGVPGSAIVENAQAVGADLIVMGTHGRRGFSHLVSGSVAEAVLRQAPCPVLTVKSPKFGPGHQRVMPETAGRRNG